MTSEHFEKLRVMVTDYLNTKQDLYVTERSIGAHEVHNLGVRLVSPSPSHALFSNNMFRDSMRDFATDKDFTILHAPELEITPSEFDTVSGTAIVTCFETNTVIIVGTFYAGEIKKSVFSILNYVLPELGVLPMHAGANKSDTETSVFFGFKWYWKNDIING